MTPPLFFEIDYAKDSPWVENFCNAEVKVERDAAGKIQSIKSRPVQPAVVIDKGSRWLDVIGVGLRKPAFILSERVIAGFQAAGITGYTAHPVSIKHVRRKKLREQPAPGYYYIETSGSLDIDFAASGIPASECSREILDTGDRPRVVKFVPDAGSWDGLDFMALRNYPTGHVFCTRRVMDVARENGLTNFCFKPPDLLHHQTIGWRKGIDYLGKTWPPKWYPPHAREIKNIDQWLGELSLAGPLIGYTLVTEKVDPILDFGLEAVPGLAQMLRTGSLQARQNAALVVYYLRVSDCFRLPENVIALAAEYLKEELLPAFKRPV